MYLHLLTHQPTAAVQHIHRQPLIRTSTLQCQPPPIRPQSSPTHSLASFPLLSLQLRNQTSMFNLNLLPQSTLCLQQGHLRWGNGELSNQQVLPACNRELVSSKALEYLPNHSSYITVRSARYLVQGLRHTKSTWKGKNTKRRRRV